MSPLAGSIGSDPATGTQPQSQQAPTLTPRARWFYAAPTWRSHLRLTGTVAGAIFKLPVVWIHQRRVKAICDGWKYRYAFDLEFDPFSNVATIATSDDLTKVCRAWEGPRIKAVQLRDYLEELEANS